MGFPSLSLKKFFSASDWISYTLLKNSETKSILIFFHLKNNIFILFSSSTGKFESLNFFWDFKKQIFWGLYSFFYKGSSLHHKVGMMIFFYDYARKGYIDRYKPNKQAISTHLVNSEGIIKLSFIESLCEIK